MSKVPIACLIFTGVSGLLYIILVYSAVNQSIKWYLFAAHLASALTGVILGIIGLWRREWICVLGLCLCVYFLVIQLSGI